MAYAFYQIDERPYFTIGYIRETKPNGDCYVDGKMFPVKPLKIVEQDWLGEELSFKLETIEEDRKEMLKTTEMYYWSRIREDKDFKVVSCLIDRLRFG